MADDNQNDWEQFYQKVTVERLPVTTINTPPLLPSFAQLITEILTFHGANIEVKAGYCTISFPEGTYKTEMLPRVNSERYLIVFPDYFEMYEIIRRGEHLSYLQVNTKQLPAGQQARMKEPLDG